MQTFFDWMSKSKYYAEEKTVGMPATATASQPPQSPNGSQNTTAPSGDNWGSGRDVDTRRNTASNDIAFNNRQDANKILNQELSANLPLITRSLKQAQADIGMISANDQPTAQTAITNIGSNLDKAAGQFLKYKNLAFKSFVKLRNKLAEKAAMINITPPPVSPLEDPAYNNYFRK
jgi:hypothetical protein